MKKNKIYRIMITVVMLVVMLGITGNAFATDPFTISAVEPTGNVGSSIQNVAGQILFIVQIIGMSVAVIMLIVLGIKFITASPDGKAEIKKSAWIYVVGALGIFAASFIVGLIKNLFGGLK